MGNFSPSVVTVPPGTHSFLVDFIPNPGLPSGTIGSLFAETTFFDDEGNTKLCLTEIELLFAPDELCEGDARYAEESDFDDNQAVFDFGITPNPANDVTEVTYDLTPFAEASLVELQVYNLQGSLVRTVLPDVENQSHRFEVLQLSSGTYLVVFRIDGDVKKVKRMLINH